MRNGMGWTDDDICRIAANTELKDGFYVNLGIGLPTKVANYIPPHFNITLHSENGMLGIGPFPDQDHIDPDIINAGKETITETGNTCYFDSSTSFAMIRGGHIDVAILGALQVSQQGDIANWIVPGKIVKGMGGAMDLVAGVKRIVVIMEHVTKGGSSKLLKQCTFPLTGIRCVDKIITNLGIFEIIDRKLYLIEMAPGVTIQEIEEKTEADFSIKKLQAVIAFPS